MKFFLGYLLLMIVSCSSQFAESSGQKEGQELMFEDRHHYRFSLTDKPFLVIGSQQKMDDVFRLIHSRNSSSKMSPIPTVLENETYLIIKPVLKSTNDIEIQKLEMKNSILYIDVKPFDDPQIQRGLRQTPNVLIRVFERISVKDIKINYN